MSFEILQLGADDLASMHALLATFGEAFDDRPTYTGKPPSEAYLRTLLGGDTFIALVACEGGNVIGGLAAWRPTN